MAEGGGMGREQPREQRPGAGGTTRQEQRGEKALRRGSSWAEQRGESMAGAEGGRPWTGTASAARASGRRRRDVLEGTAGEAAQWKTGLEKSALREVVVRGREGLGG